MPRALRPGEDHAFDDQVLTARVPELDDVPVGDPLRVTERINPLAMQSRVNRRFANLHPRQEFTVAFPAELESVASLESQTPGRAALLVVQVRNRSRFDLGRDSATQRFLGIRIELRNQDMARHVMQLDLQGQQIPWDTGLSRGDSISWRRDRRRSSAPSWACCPVHPVTRRPSCL